MTDGSSAAKVCTECGKTGATLRRDDAADEEHWFHIECWKDFMWWLAGHNGKRPRNKESGGTEP